MEKTKIKPSNRIFKRAALLLLLSFFVFAHHSATNAAFNKEINYQGKLLDDAGTEVTDGDYNLRFRLCAASDCSGGSDPVWTETHCYSPDSGATCDGSGTDQRIGITGGIFSQMLGSISSMSSVDFNQILYLEVQVGGSGSTPSWETLTPRKELGAVPAAFESDKLDGLDAATSGTDAHIVATDSSGNLTASANLNLGADVLVFRGAADRMDIGDGDSLNLVNGNFQIAGTTVIDSSRALSNITQADIDNIRLDGNTISATDDGGLNLYDNAGLGLTLLDGGSVGIGTASPNHLLDVNGNIGIVASGYLNFDATDGTDGYGFRDNAGTLEFKNSGGSWSTFGGGSLPSGTEGQMLYSDAGTWTAFDGVYWDDTNARLGIGTTSPGYAVDVTGDVNVSGQFLVNGVPFSGSSQWTTSGSDIYYDSGNVGVGTSSPLGRLHSDLTSTSSTAGNEYDLYLTVSDTGAVSSGTDNTFGSYIDVVRTGATGGDINTYGSYLTVTGDNAGNSNVWGTYVNAVNGDNTYGVYATAYVDNSSVGDNPNIYGVYATASDLGAGDASGIIGVYSSAYNNSLGSVSTSLQGVVAQASNTGGDISLLQAIVASGSNDSDGDIGTMYGIQSQLDNNSSGDIGFAYGGWFRIANSGTGTLSMGYGIHIASALNGGGGTFAGNYGLYIEDQSGVGSTESFNLYSAGDGLNYFGGRLGIGTAAPEAPIHIVSSSPSMYQERYTDVAEDGAGLLMRRARGTPGAYNTVQVNDHVASLSWAAYSATTSNFVGMARIRAYIDGEPNTAGDTSDMPGRMEFLTVADGSSTIQVRMVIKNNGNVGIGTTNPLAKLHIEGTGGGNAGIYMNSAAPSSTTNTLYNSGGTLMWNGSAIGGVAFPSGTEGQMLYSNAGTWTAFDGVYWDDTNSRLGIGTTSPGAKLSVQEGYISTTGTGTNNGLTVGTTDNTTGSYAMINLGSTNNSLWIVDHAPARIATRFGLTLGGYTEISSTGTSSNGLVIGTQTEDPLIFGANNAEALRILSGGNVGIGTTSPSNKLHVEGTPSGSAGIYLNDAAPGTTTATLYNSSGSLYWAGTNISAGLMPTGTEGQMLYSNAGSWTAFDGMYWDDTNSRVGIGTTSPAARLSVSGDTFAGGSNWQTPHMVISVPGYSDVARLAFVHGSGGQAYIDVTSGAGGDSSDILFYTRLSTMNERMRIASTGNVGIGVTNPSERLEIAGGNLRVWNDNELSNEKVTSWTNHSTQIYETFTTSGTDITQAANTTAVGSCYSNGINVKAGQLYKATFTMTNNSGTLPAFRVASNQALTTYSLTQATTSGANTIYFYAPVTGTIYVGFYTATGVTADFAVSTFSFKQVIGGNVIASGQYTGGGVNGIKVDTDGNVGIGTTSPLNLLEVGGGVTGSLTGNVIAVSNESGNSTLGLGQSPSARGRLFWGYNATEADAYLGLGTVNTSNPLVLQDSGGDVGIGTTTPGAKLHVATNSQYSGYFDSFNGGTTISDISGLVVANTNNTNNNWTGLLFADTSGGSPSAAIGAQLTDRTNDYGDLAFMTRSASGYSEKMRILSGGNVGIGTTSPGTKLDVAGTSILGGRQITSRDTAAQAADVGGGISFYGKYTDAGAYAVFGEIKAGKDNATTGNYAGYLTLSAQSGSTLTEWMRITSGGKVGIGTTNPENKLDINLASGDGIRLGQVDIGAGTTRRYIGLNDLGAAGTFDGGAYLSIDGDNTGNYGLTIQTQEYGVANHQVTFKYNGNVGIGTTNPGAKLHTVVGGTLATRALFATSDWASLTAGSGVVIGTGAATGDTYSVIDSYDQGGNSIADLILNPSGGNVGIGTTTPNQKLQIMGGQLGVFNGASDRGLTINPGLTAGVVDVYTDYFGGTEPKLHLSTYTHRFGPAGITIDTAGNVGIGTTTPGEKLTIVGSSSVNPLRTIVESGVNRFAGEAYSNTATDETQMNLRRSRGTLASPQVLQSGDYIGSIPFAGTGYDGAFKLAASIRSVADAEWGTAGDASDNPTRLEFATAPDGTQGPVIRMVINNAGSIRFNAYGAGTLTTDASGNITASSDERLKNVSGSFDRGLAAIMGIDPISYFWKTSSGLDTRNEYSGFSAQNVRQFIPEAIDTDPRGYLTLSDRPILAAAVNAIQEQQATIIEHGTLIDDLDLKITGSSSDVSALQNSINEKLSIVSDSLATLGSTVEENTAKIMALETDMEDAQTKLQENENNIATFQSSVNDTLSSMLETDNLLTEKVLSHDERIAALEAKMGAMTIMAGGEIPANVLAADEDGNLRLEGVFEAKEVVAESYSVKNDSSEKATVGEAKITPAEENDGQDSGSDETQSDGKTVKVLTEAVNGKSKILVTPVGATPVSWIVSSIEDGVGFTITLSEKTKETVKFNWWIVKSL